MELPELIKALEQVELDRENSSDYLDFTLGIPAASAKRLVRQGWWHVWPVAEQRTALLALRLLPDRPWTQWPVVRLFDENRAVTFAPNLSALPAFALFNSIYQDEELIQDTWEEWDTILNLVRALPDAFGGVDKMEQARQWMEAALVNKLPEARFRTFWEEAYPEPDLLLLTETISRMQADEDFLPVVHHPQDPVVKDRWAHLVGIRAYQLFPQDFAPDKLYPHLRQSWEATPGFDAAAMVIDQRPSTTSDSDIQDFQTAEALLTGVFSPDPGSTWMKIALELVRQKRRGYSGEAHYRAAEGLTTAPERKGEIWQLAVAASYWSGMTKSPVHEQARQLVQSLAEQWNSGVSWAIDRNIKQTS